MGASGSRGAPDLIRPISSSVFLAGTGFGGLKSREKAEYETALNKVIAVCQDRGVVDRAKKELRGE